MAPTQHTDQPATRLVHHPRAGGPTTAPSRRRPVLIGGGVLLVAVVVAAAVIGHTTSTSHPAAAASKPGPPRAAVVPPGEDAHSPAGAKAAAARDVVALGGAGMFTATTRDSTIARVVDPAVEATVGRQFDQTYTATYARFGLDTDGRAPAGETLVARAIPIGTRTVTYTGPYATIAVWSDGLIGLAGNTSTRPVTEAWATTTVHLHWTDQGWKWLSGNQSGGPTPVPGLQAPSPAGAIAGAVRSFGGLNYAP